jgi:hypothetical protein
VSVLRVWSANRHSQPLPCCPGLCRSQNGCSIACSWSSVHGLVDTQVLQGSYTPAELPLGVPRRYMSTPRHPRPKCAERRSAVEWIAISITLRAHVRVTWLTCRCYKAPTLLQLRRCTQEHGHPPCAPPADCAPPCTPPAQGLEWLHPLRRYRQYMIFERALKLNS